MAEQNHEILRVEHLKKFFPVPNGMLHAVDDISFTIDAGKTLGVVGESGCGKSTMGRAILRLHEPTDGKVYFDQKDIRALNDKQMKDMRRDMQIIFQDPFASLNPRMTVSEAIAAPLLVQKLLDRKDKEGIQKRVREIMDMVGLAGRLINTYPHELDGGRRQRIGIARALALEPKFIVCDEPVSALDVSIQAQILNLMQDLQDNLGLTYLFITHDLSVVKYISDDILGCFIGSMQILIMVAPLLMNLATALGMSYVQMGVMAVLNVTLGLITPPMAPALFVTAKATGNKFETALKYTVQFLIPMFITLMITTFWEPLTMFLPRLLGSM